MKTAKAKADKASTVDVGPEVVDRAVVFPIRKTASFVTRSISSGKRRTYEVAVTAHGHDNVTLDINGSSTHLSAEGVRTLCGLLGDLDNDLSGNERIHHGVSRKGVSGDPEFDPAAPAVVDTEGRVLRTEGQNDEVDAVEAKIRSEARSLEGADADLSGVADADAKAAELAQKEADQKAQTQAEVKTREADAKKDAKEKAKADAKADDKK